MAKKKKAKDIDVTAEELPKIKLTEHTLKARFNGKEPGDTIKVGPIGEAFYKSKNII